MAYGFRWTIKDIEVKDALRTIVDWINDILEGNNLSENILLDSPIVTGDFIPKHDNTSSLGTLLRRFKNFFLAGTAYIGTLSAESGNNVVITIPAGKKVVIKNSSGNVRYSFDENGNLTVYGQIIEGTPTT